MAPRDVFSGWQTAMSAGATAVAKAAAASSGPADEVLAKLRLLFVCWVYSTKTTLLCVVFDVGCNEHAIYA